MPLFVANIPKLSFYLPFQHQTYHIQTRYLPGCGSKQVYVLFIPACAEKEQTCSRRRAFQKADQAEDQNPKRKLDLISDLAPKFNR